MTNMVYVEYRDEIKIIKSEHISFNSNEITQYKILGEHIKYRIQQNHSLDHAISGIVEWKKMLASDRKKTFYQYYYTILDNQLENENYDIIPSGNYLVVYHKGTYETSYQSYHLFLDYAKKNHLILDDIAYDESLIDELTEVNPQNYITQISVKFKKKSSKRALMHYFFYIVVFFRFQLNSVFLNEYFQVLLQQVHLH